jgi:hypothetical protein
MPQYHGAWSAQLHQCDSFLLGAPARQLAACKTLARLKANRAARGETLLPARKTRGIDLFRGRQQSKKLPLDA